MAFKTTLRCLRGGISDRDEFIGSSLAPSAALFERVSGGANENNKERLCLMDFHREWQHEDCPVMRWYGDQKSSSTRFHSIQYRRDANPPFFHEYLLLELRDDCICRVERTGDGSRVDAVRNIGCSAKDYIQWFTANDYKSFTRDKPSELIAEVDFHHEFDILDVLAICYAVHKWRRTRAYTLQRFNCYFLCGTILLVLARRVSHWETVTLDTWRSALHQKLDQLLHSSHDSPHSPLILRVCNYLDPNNQNPAGFLFNAINNGLEANTAYDNVRQAIAGTLWSTTWNENLSRALTDHVDTALTTALEGDELGATALKSATSGSLKVLQEKIESFAAAKKIADEASLKGVTYGIVLLDRAREELHRMESMEEPTSSIQSFMISVAGHTLGTLFPVQLALTKGDMEDWGFKGILLGSVRGIIAARTIGVVNIKQRLRTGRGLGVRETAFAETPAAVAESSLRANSDMAARSLEEILLRLREKDMLTPPNLTVALHIVLSKNLWDSWLNISIRDLLEIPLSKIQPEKEQILVRVQRLDQGGSTVDREIKTVVELQDYMKERIITHAARVEMYRLAAAPLVKQDIQNAMTDVWKSMPAGFGSVIDGLEGVAH